MSGDFFPTVILGEGRWDYVIRALRLTGTKRDEALAAQIVTQLSEQRERRTQREAPEPS